jgi:probable HAF family extracellular repeat protein
MAVFTTFDAPSGLTFVNGVNDSGQVVGSFLNSHGFLYSGGVFTTLDAPGAISTLASGINDAGNVVGSFSDGSGNHGFLYSGGTYLTLNDPSATNGTNANGINAAGQIVGAYKDASGGVHGFVYSGGVYTTLDDPLANGANTQANGINDLGQIVGTYSNATGTHGFLYSNGAYTTIDDPAGTTGNSSQGINDAGQIVGFYSDSIGFHGYVQSNGNFTSLDDPSGLLTVANGIANTGTIGGTFTDSGKAVHGWLSNESPPPAMIVPAVTVEATMYGATGTAAEITNLTNNFLPAQVANALNHGLNALVYASEVLGLAFAFGNETGSAAFANNFGPSNTAMPNTAAGDAAFASAASGTIFGAASTANLVNVMRSFVSFWEGFYTANGVPGLNASAAQIDLAARGAAWGDMVGVALANNLGPLNGQVVNFLEDTTQGTAVYGASLVGQPMHHF